jgi:hypothetical protein
LPVVNTAIKVKYAIPLRRKMLPIFYRSYTRLILFQAISTNEYWHGRKIAMRERISGIKKYISTIFPEKNQAGNSMYINSKIFNHYQDLVCTFTIADSN